MPAKSTPTIVRFESRIVYEPSCGCWLWSGHLSSSGYGLFNVVDTRVGGKQIRKTTSAHRFSYELVHGSIPHGMVTDHLCRNRACVNPDHLEVVTQAENVFRGDATKNKRTGLCHRCGSPDGRVVESTSKGYSFLTWKCRPCLARQKKSWEDRKRSLGPDFSIEKAARFRAYKATGSSKCWRDFVEANND